MINKEPVRVGGENALVPIVGYPMFRKYITFEGNREREYIQVQYQEWIDVNGVALEFNEKSYFVKDIPEVSHIDENNVLVIDSPMIPMFSEGWLKRKVKATANGLMINGVIIAPLGVEVNFGDDLIVGSINATLVAMPFDAANPYDVTP